MEKIPIKSETDVESSNGSLLSLPLGEIVAADIPDEGLLLIINGKKFFLTESQGDVQVLKEKFDNESGAKYKAPIAFVKSLKLEETLTVILGKEQLDPENKHKAIEGDQIKISARYSRERHRTRVFLTSIAKGANSHIQIPKDSLTRGSREKLNLPYSEVEKGEVLESMISEGQVLLYTWSQCTGPGFQFIEENKSHRTEIEQKGDRDKRTKLVRLFNPFYEIGKFSDWENLGSEQGISEAFILDNGANDDTKLSMSDIKKGGTSEKAYRLIYFFQDKHPNPAQRQYFDAVKRPASFLLLCVYLPEEAAEKAYDIAAKQDPYFINQFMDAAVQGDLFTPIFKNEWERTGNKVWRDGASPRPPQRQVLNRDSSIKRYCADKSLLPGNSPNRTYNADNIRRYNKDGYILE